MRPSLPLRASRVAEALGPCRFGGQLEVLGVVSSTQDLVREKAERGAPDGFTLTAEGQEAGRGRRGSAWRSPARRGVYVSVLLRPPPAGDRLLLLGTALGVAAADAVESLGLEAGIKWPNDVLVSRRKVAGVLVEVFGDPASPFAVLGAGFNAGFGPEDLPESAPVPAGSLSLFLDRPVDREALLVSFLLALERSLAVLAGPDPVPLLESFRRRDVLRGARAVVQEGSRIHEGLVLQADPRLGLRLKTDLGDEVRLRPEHCHIVNVRW